MKYAILSREKQVPESSPKQMLGVLSFYENEASKKELIRLYTLELPWNNNRPFHSCIPSGRYECVPCTWSKYTKKGDYFAYEVKDVLMRDDIRIHYGNFYTNTNGCILPGLDTYDLNKDGIIDVKRSKDAMRRITEIAPEGFTLNIIDKTNYIGYAKNTDYMKNISL